MGVLKGILLDLDGTLIDDRGSARVAFDAFLAAHQVDVNRKDELADLWRTVTARHWRRYESGEINFLEQRRCRVRDFLERPLSDREADEAFLPYLNVYESSWKLLPGVVEFLDKTRHVPKVIVTNGDRDQQLRKIQATGLAEHVVGVVTPADCGHWKPNPGIFLAGLAMLGLKASECLMVGDDERRDIEPARQLGMSCILIANRFPVAEIDGIKNEFHLSTPKSK